MVAGSDSYQRRTMSTNGICQTLFVYRQRTDEVHEANVDEMGNATRYFYPEELIVLGLSRYKD